MSVPVLLRSMIEIVLLATASVFFFGRRTAAYMSLCFVLFKDCAAFAVHVTVYSEKPLMHILVDCGLADVEYTRSGAHRRFVIDYVLRGLKHALFNIVFHYIPPYTRLGSPSAAQKITAKKS